MIIARAALSGHDWNRSSNVWLQVVILIDEVVIHWYQVIEVPRDIPACQKAVVDLQ